MTATPTTASDSPPPRSTAEEDALIAPGQTVETRHSVGADGDDEGEAATVEREPPAVSLPEVRCDILPNLPLLPMLT